MTNLILDTGALQRLAEAGAPNLLLSSGNTVTVTSTVLAELKYAEGLGYSSAADAVNWIAANTNGGV